MFKSNECFISVDIETAGPNPSDYALLSIGACTLREPRETFYIELIPTSSEFTQDALEVSHLDLDQLKKTGVPPEEAMLLFSQWVQHVLPENGSPVFVAFNAPFDWMFINDYFHHYLGYNPFGHKAIDIKALYMGIYKTRWKDTSFEAIRNKMEVTAPLKHHALDDAVQQADLLCAILDELKGDNHG
jgi:DNA polymerase III alpha subunit (gram-positive type)